MNPITNRILTLGQAGLLGLFTHTAIAAGAPADFAKYDTDKNGVVSEAEYTAQGGKPDIFRLSDTNRDGVLSPDEFLKAASNKDRADAAKYMDDAWITTKVKAALLKEKGLDGLDVSVETMQGTVKLKGEVNSPAQIRQAETIAAGIEGVKSVRNELQVKNARG